MVLLQIIFAGMETSGAGRARVKEGAEKIGITRKNKNKRKKYPDERKKPGRGRQKTD